MVERARRHARDLGLTTVEFLLGEVEFLPVADASVDVVISNCVINLVLDKAQVFREAFRVLRAGGRLSISDVVTRGKLPDALRGALSAWAACIGGATTVEDYVAFLRAAGFEDIQVRTSQGASVRLPMMSAHLTARKPLAS
jgi:ubiquinone/menaquinone biosynthesis C-methylase UbiE